MLIYDTDFFQKHDIFFPAAINQENCHPMSPPIKEERSCMRATSEYSVSSHALKVPVHHDIFQIMMIMYKMTNTTPGFTPALQWFAFRADHTNGSISIDKAVGGSFNIFSR